MCILAGRFITPRRRLRIISQVYRSTLHNRRFFQNIVSVHLPLPGSPGWMDAEAVLVKWWGRASFYPGVLLFRYVHNERCCQSRKKNCEIRPRNDG